RWWRRCLRHRASRSTWRARWESRWPGSYVATDSICIQAQSGSDQKRETPRGQDPRQPPRNRWTIGQLLPRLTKVQRKVVRSLTTGCGVQPARSLERLRKRDVPEAIAIERAAGDGRDPLVVVRARAAAKIRADTLIVEIGDRRGRQSDHEAD